jgi:hypothetical protein
MIFFVLLHVFFIFVRESYSGWNMTWNEEFDNKIIDTNKWEIENEINACHG